MVDLDNIKGVADGEVTGLLLVGTLDIATTPFNQMGGKAFDAAIDGTPVRRQNFELAAALFDFSHDINHAQAPVLAL